jgi:dihydroxy-acid dehydratase
MSQEGISRGGGELFGEPSVDGFIHRAFQRGAGQSAELVRRRPVVGICTSWSELNPCNLGLDRVADAVKRGVLAAGGWPLIFPTISISEPFSRPSSLLLRNLMSMDVEQMVVSSPIDAVVLLGGCDKTLPAQLMGAVSADRPTLSVPAGPRVVQRWNGAALTIDELWTMADQRRRGLVDDETWERLESCINGSPGTCNVMGTATTMAVVAEVLGFTLVGTALHPSGSSARVAGAEHTGSRIVKAVADSVVPSALVTDQSIENAVRVTCAIGGSTNALLHIVAVAGRAGIDVTHEQLRSWTSSTPLLVDVRPSGRYLLADLEELGGVPAVMRELAPLLHMDTVTADGRTWAQVIAHLPSRNGPALRSWTDPVDPHGALAIVSGSLAPDGAVIKTTASDPRLSVHTGPALVFEGVADLRARIDDPDLDVDADSVLVLRGVGPRGGPGMPEVGHLAIPSRLLAAGITDMVRVSDARMSGTATGTVVLHVAPEAAVGGPLAWVHDGDLISLDVAGGRLDLLVEPAELARRAASMPVPGQRPGRGYDQLHWDHVLQADSGCDFDFLMPGGTPER